MRTPALLLAFVASVSFVIAAPEAFEVGPEQKSSLPGGREADGIIGDFILRNDKIEAVVSGNLPLRRANMSTFYGESGITLRECDAAKTSMPGRHSCADSVFGIDVQDANRRPSGCRQAGKKAPIPSEVFRP